MQRPISISNRFCEALGFRWLREHQRGALLSALRQRLVRTDDRQRLLGFARRWLYEHHLIIVHRAATSHPDCRRETTA
jgi:hypothetical protein